MVDRLLPGAGEKSVDCQVVDQHFHRAGKKPVNLVGFSMICQLIDQYLGGDRVRLVGYLEDEMGYWMEQLLGRAGS
jgi:hypothetical protein